MDIYLKTLIERKCTEDTRFFEDCRDPSIQRTEGLSAKKVLEKLEEGKDGIAELQDYERQYQNDRITTKYRRDQHLASALSLSSIKFIMNKSIMEKLQGGKRTHKPYCHNVLVKGQSGMPVELKEGHNHAFLSCLISNFPNDLDQYCMTKMRWKVQNQEMCEDLVRAVDRATQVSVDHLYDSFDDDCKPNVELKPTEISPYTQKLLLAKIDAQLAVQLASNDRERQRVLSVLGRQFTIVDNYIKFQCTKGKDKEDWHCGTWNHFLAYVDFILGHSAISLYLDFVKSKRKGAKVQYELYHDLSQLIFKAHFHYGNKVYNLLKNLKPFFTAIIMELIEPIKDEVFIRDCKAELMSNFNEANMPFYDMLLIWLSKLKDKINDKRELSHQLIFYSSLVKSYGHPDVDMMKGVEKVRRIGARDKQVDKEIVRLVTGCVKWNFVESYFNVNKQWPIILNPPSVILKYINIQKLPPKRLHFTFAKLLIDARFGKMFDFETFDNGKDLLKDSAVIQSSSHWPFEYDQDAFYYVNNIHLPRYVRDEKRVILTDLKDEMDVRYEVEKFNDQGPNDNDLIIIAIPKERELKEEPRLFVKLTYKMRMLQILAENNVAQHVLRFSESQSMIMKSDKVMQKLLEFSGKVRYDDFIKVAQSMIHADFQSWNLQFREEMMGGVMSFFDEIHGLSQYYTRFHQFFADSTVMVQDMFNPPRMDPYTGKAIPDEYTCWQLHWGGFEGMLQKSWTVFTMGLLTLAAFETHSEITSFGSGDNQIVLLTLSPTPLVKDLSLKIQREKMNKINDEEMMTDFRNKTLNHIHRYRNKLTSFAALIELPLKKEESFFTFGLMEYGSEMSVLGVSAAYESKVLFRLGTNINSPVKSIFDNLVTPGANGVSGSMKCYNPISLYQISTFETLFCAAGYGLFHQTLIGVPENDYKLVTTSKWSPYSMRIEDGKYNLYREIIRRSGVRLILIPRLFGGISCPPLYSYLFRGYEDDLCFTLDLARFLMTNAKNQEDFDLGNELLDININENDSVDTLLLLESPYSLPVKSFPLPQNVYDTITSRVLYEFTKEKNPGMAKVYKAIETRDIEKETAKAIADTVPFYPLWGAPCLEITPVMQARQSLRRFSTTTSIRQMVYSQDELTQDILDKTVQIYNLNTIRWLRWRILDWSNKPRPDIQKSKIYPIVSPWIVQLMDCSMTVGEIADEMRCFYWKREIQGVTNYWFRDQVYIKRSDGVTTDERQQLIELIADYDLDQQQPEWGIEYTRGNFRATLGSKTQMKLKGGLVEVDMSSIQTKYLVALLKRIIWASDGDSLYDLGRQIAAQITPQSFEDLLPLMPMYVGGSIEHRASGSRNECGIYANSPRSTNCHYSFRMSTGAIFNRESANRPIYFQGIQQTPQGLLRGLLELGTFIPKPITVGDQVPCRQLSIVFRNNYCFRILNEEKIKYNGNYRIPNFSYLPKIFPRFKSRNSVLYSEFTINSPLLSPHVLLWGIIDRMFNHTVKFIELKVNTRESTIDNILVPDGISLSFFDRVSIKNLFIYLGFVIRNTVFATQVNKKKFSPGEHKDIIMGLAFIIAQWCSECQFFSKISSFFYGNPFDYLNYSQLKPRANLMYRILLLFTTKESYHPIVWRGRTILPFSIFHYSQSSSRRIYRSLKNFIQQEGTDDQKEQITIFENMRSCYVYDLYHKRVEVDSSQISMEKILAECGINLDTYTTEMLAAISGRMEKINDEIELTERLVLKMDGNIDITRHMISGLELSAEHVNMESNNDYKKDLSHLYRPLTSGDTTIFKGYLFAPFIWEYMAPNKELSVLVFGTGFGSILGGIVDKALNTTAGCITFYLHDFNPERSKGVSTLENVGDFLRQYPSDKVKIKITPESSITHSNLLIVDNYLKIINSFGQLYYDIIIWDCEGNLSTQASLFQKFLIAKPILDEVSEVVIYKFPTAISHSLSGIDIKYNNVLWHPGMSSVTLEVYILQSRDPPFRMILDEFDNNFMILREDPNYCWRMYAESISLIQLYSCVFFSGHNVLLLQFVSTCYFKGKDSLNYSHYRRLLLDFVLPKNSYEAKDFENCIPIYVCLMAFFLDSKAPLGDLYTRVTSDNKWFEEPYQSYISHMELARSYIQRGISLPNVKYIFRQIFRYHFATDSLKHTLIILRRVYNFLGYINMNKVSMKETLSLDLEQAGQYINDPLLRIKF